MTTKRMRQFRFRFKSGMMDQILLEPEDKITHNASFIQIKGTRPDKNREFTHVFFRDDLSHYLLMEWDEDVQDHGPRPIPEPESEAFPFR